MEHPTANHYRFFSSEQILANRLLIAWFISILWFRSSIIATRWMLFANKSSTSLATDGEQWQQHRRRTEQQWKWQRRSDGTYKWQSKDPAFGIDLCCLRWHQFRQTLWHFGVQWMLGILQTQRTTKIDLSVSVANAPDLFFLNIFIP